MNTTIRHNTASESDDIAYYAGFQHLASQLHTFKRDLQLLLAASRGGRVILHTAAALASRHFAWHFRGIVRELTRH